jgi:hypothetical protein
MLCSCCCGNAAALIVQACAGGPDFVLALRVALPVRLQQGPSWGELAEYDEDRQVR